MSKKPKSTRLSTELQQFDLLTDSEFVGRMLDSNLIIKLQEADRCTPQRQEMVDGYLRPDVFVRDIGRNGALCISYVTLFEVIDPRRRMASDPNRPMETLSNDERSIMYDRIELLRRYGIRVVGINDEAFALAMDLWFDSRQGRNPDKHDTALLDPLIAATAIVRGMQFVSLNVTDFLAFRRNNGLKLKPVVELEGRGFLKFGEF